MKLGLVLEGGAMRGLFTAGVLDVLMENGLQFDGIIGVSAGACFGCNYITKQVGRTLRYNLRFAKDPRYCSIRSLIKTGDIFGSEFCYHILPEELDPYDFKAYEQSQTKFYVVATDVNTGQAVYHCIDHMEDDGLEWIRASASMPFAAKIVELGGGKYLDGGVSDSIPLKAFEEMGYDVNVTVLTKPRGYRKSPNKLMALVRCMYRKYPKFIDAMKVRHIAYNNQLDDVFESEKAGKNFVICPKEPLPVGHITHNPEVMKDVYELGRKSALDSLEELKKFIEANGV